MESIINMMVLNAADPDGNIRLPVDQVLELTNRMRAQRVAFNRLRSAALRFLRQNEIQNEEDRDSVQRAIDLHAPSWTEDQKESLVAAVALWDAAKEEHVG